MTTLKLNCGFDHNLFDSNDDKPHRGEWTLAKVDGQITSKRFAFSGGSHLMVSSTGGVGKTQWARERAMGVRIIHFMEPDGIHDPTGRNEYIANNLNELCSLISEAWDSGITPFVNSLSAVQFASYNGFSLAEGGYSLGFTSMLTQLSHQLVGLGLPLVVALNARRESDSDSKFIRALNDLESSVTSVWWFKTNGDIHMKTRSGALTLDGVAYEYNRKSWRHVKFQNGSLSAKSYKNDSDAYDDGVGISSKVSSIWKD